MAEPYPPMLARKRCLGGAEEVTPGTLPAIVAPFAANIYDAKLELVDLFRDGERKPDAIYSGSQSSVPSGQVGQLTFREELIPGGPFLALLTGAGYKAAGGTYAPTSDLNPATGQKTWGFKLWRDGGVRTLAGCAGSFTLEIPASGRRVFANWTWLGIYDEPADAALPAQTPVATLPYRGKGLTATLATAVMPHHPGMMIDSGNQISARENSPSAQGVAYYIVSDRTPTISIDTEARTRTQLDTFTKLTAATLEALSIALTSGAHVFTVAAPKVQRIEKGSGERERIATDPIRLLCCINAGDDELTFTET